MVDVAMVRQFMTSSSDDANRRVGRTVENLAGAETFDKRYDYLLTSVDRRKMSSPATAEERYTKR